MTETLVEAHGLATGYAGTRPALRGVTFTAAPGESVAVLGPNGGGKTTLFRALLGELQAWEGTCAVHGSLAYVPQSEDARLDFPVSALDVALMGAYARTPWYRRLSPADRAAALRALDRVGLGPEARRPYGELSRGQRQRVLIARALVQDARVLLLDEPLAGVDRTSEERILELLGELRAGGRALLVATHDIEGARRFDRVLCLNGEMCAFGEPADALSPAVLERTYGGELVVLGGGARAIAIGHHDHDH